MKWLLALVRQILQHIPHLLHIRIIPDDFEPCLDLGEFGEVVRREPGFAGNQQMPIFSTRYQREVRLIQSLKSGQHFATSIA